MEAGRRRYVDAKNVALGRSIELCVAVAAVYIRKNVWCNQVTNARAHGIASGILLVTQGSARNARPGSKQRIADGSLDAPPLAIGEHAGNPATGLPIVAGAERAIVAITTGLRRIGKSRARGACQIGLGIKQPVAAAAVNVEAGPTGR